MASIKTFPIFIVDAFSTQAFAGNPAAVCLLEGPITDEVKQKIAAEMNLSETAFVWPLDESPKTFAGSKRFSLQWFTPTTEVPLCGHATLATSAVLFFVQGNNNQTLEFETKFSGLLKATRSFKTESIEMQLPLNPPNRSVSKNDEKAVWQVVQEVLKGQSKWTQEDVKEVKLSPVTKKLLIRLSDRICQTDLEALERPDGITSIDTGDRVRGVIVTVKSPEKYDFLSRYFAPWVGIPEDPVTGSAHTVLAPYWAGELGKKDFFARQCSKRGGEVTLRVEDDFLRISGNATIVLKGAITF
ncbi:phenazine biosynthesis-like domain-containing protein [Tigriopus californicus]|uniref:phenazine biosynthesis-like domain-containing protein n=1 Tax=Tigriopus californicus TaxID=6832 RepID=UPI0027D9F739|nr:phenazine biosynthesis-like domain-containing protein [Tigriopus californicus]